MTMVQGNFESIEQMKNDILTLKKDWLKIKESQDDEDLNLLKLEKKNSLQIQKDTIRSCQNIEKDYSAIKAKLSKVYGKEFFER